MQVSRYNDHTLISYGLIDMRQIIIFLTISLFALGMVINEASAARFGGGRSFGYKRPMSSYSSTFNKAAPAASAAGKASSSRWGGMLGGLLVGGLLASLFMGHGLASGLMSWLIVGALALFLINLYRRKMQPHYQSASTSPFQQNPLNFSALSNFANSSTSANTHFQDDFDTETFIRDAKVKFIRLQEAYDKKNVADLSAFTTPEVLAEIKLQLQERGEAENYTDVVSVDAEFLDKSVEQAFEIASVCFTALIKEDGNPAQKVEEIWNFSRVSSEAPWLVSGIEQKSMYNSR